MAGISVGDAILKVGADTGDMDKGLDRIGKNIQKGVDKWKGQLRAAGAAFTAVGVAGLKLAADSRKMNASLGQTALTLGGTTKELRNLALATTNVTFPLQSVTNTFDLLARAGIRDQQVLAATATAFDTLGDATGASAETVAGQLIPAFKLFGLEIPKSAEELDNFTWLTKNTTVELSEFGSIMSYVAQYGDKLNLSLDDMVAIMAVLESKGKSGSTATKMFRTAVTQAASGAATLNEALGITNEEVSHFRGEMAAATGITQEYADVANTQYGLMDKLKQKWSEITLVLGSFLEPLEPIMGAMAALGPVMMILSTSMGQAAVRTVAHTVALIAHNAALLASRAAMGIATAAQWLWNAALTANPIGIIITIIGTLIVALIALATKFSWMRDFLVKVWDNIKIVFAKAVKVILEKAIKPFLDGLAAVIDFAADVVGFFNKEWGDSMRRAAKSVRGAIDDAIEWTHTMEDNARAHLEGKDAIEKVTKATHDEIMAAMEYDEALYGINLTTEKAVQVTENLADAHEDATQAIEDHKKAVAGFERTWLDLLGTLEPSVKLWKDIGASAEDAFELMVEMSGLTGERLAKTFAGYKINANDWATHWGEMCRIAGISGEDFISALELRFGDLSEEIGGISDALQDVSDEALAAAAAAITPGAPTGGFQADIAAIVDQIVFSLSSLYDMSAVGSDWIEAWRQSLVDWLVQFQSVDQMMAAVQDYIQNITAYIPYWTTTFPPLPSFQHGGLIREPTLLYGLRSHTPYAVAETGERVSPAGGVGGAVVTNTFQISELVVREEADIYRIAKELKRLQELRGAIRG